jgi:hypothetical protein
MRPGLRPLSALLVSSTLLCMVAGCMEPQTTPARPARIDSGYRTQQLNTNDYESAFAAAQGAVMEHFQIASADRATGMIQLVPSESTRPGGARVRKMGQVIIQKSGSFVVAAVQVRIEKYATPSIRVIESTFAADDRPGKTPIQEEAGLTRQQQEYWTPEGRDVAMEAQILNRITEAISAVGQGPSTQPASGSQPAPAGQAQL